MRYTAKLFIVLASFFVVMAVIYTVWGTIYLPDRFEPVGIVGLALSALFFLFIAGYLHVTERRLDPAPEDDLRGNIEQVQGDFGFFSPHSWMPLFLAGTAALLFLGVAMGWWIFAIGVFLGIPALIGWTFEYFKGQHAN
ncbi:MAG: cytochrome c oxidase subunit 4 [Dermatophilaceae bacterium]|nr:cytochrome c oxidase subunit 4 [Intrasporangiaceae bacterium]